MPETYRTPQGTFDVLAPESKAYEDLIAAFAAHVERAGYGLVISPMFEDIGVFQRVGESTDVVRKEMYDFEDKGGRRIALRPEGTASVVRAFVQHRPPVPFKAWYAAPSFRYERPQAGRFRQHHQLGIEALGTDDPYLDVEVIALLTRFHRAAGITRTTLHLTSLGDTTCQPPYRAELAAYLADHNAELCDEHRDHYANPLRVLDCKRPACIKATADAPAQLDRLCEACAAHFETVTGGLDALGIAHTIDRRLVRGFDYYTRTAFEVAAHAIDAAQNGIGGGGRYDRLTEELGGPPTPGVGFGTGIERVLLAAQAEGVTPPLATLDAFVVDTTGGLEGLRLTDELRAAGISTDRAFDGRSMKSQMKSADRSGARVAVIVGSAELQRGVITIRPLRGGGDQHEVVRDGVVDHVRKLL